MSEFTKGKWNAFYGEVFHGIRAAHADDEQGHDYGNGQFIAPCSMCQRLILNAGIKHVITRNSIHDKEEQL